MYKNSKWLIIVLLLPLLFACQSEEVSDLEVLDFIPELRSIEEPQLSVRSMDLTDFLTNADDFNLANNELNAMMTGVPVVTGLRKNTANKKIGPQETLVETKTWLDKTVDIEIKKDTGNFIYYGRFPDQTSYFQLTYEPGNKVFDYVQEVILNFTLEGTLLKFGTVCSIADVSVDFDSLDPDQADFSSDQLTTFAYVQEGADARPMKLGYQGKIKKVDTIMKLQFNKMAMEEDAGWTSGSIVLEDIEDMPANPFTDTDFVDRQITAINDFSTSSGWLNVSPGSDPREVLQILVSFYGPSTTFPDPDAGEMRAYLVDFDAAHGTGFTALYDDGVATGVDEDFSSMNQAIGTYIWEN